MATPGPLAMHAYGLHVLEGGFPSQTDGVRGPPDPVDCRRPVPVRPRAICCILGLRKQQWHLWGAFGGPGALLRHQSGAGDGSQSDDASDEIKLADKLTPINAWCHGHAFTSERGLLPRPSRGFVAMATKPRMHLQHGVLISHKYKT